MKLVEVLMLMGAHCVSPLEQTQMTTDATKVQCAVVIEKDTGKGTLTVNPREAAADPLVAAAVARFAAAPVDPLSSSGARILPARAPAGTPPVEVKVSGTSAAMPPSPSAEEPSAAAAAVPPPPAAGRGMLASPEPEQEVAVLAPAKPQRPPAKAEPAAKPPAKAKVPGAKPPAKAKVPGAISKGQCKGTAVAKWYTAADGHRRYRCVRPEPAGYKTPAQLY